MSMLAIDVFIAGTSVVLRVAGEVDIATTDDVRQTVLAHLTSDDCAELILDAGNITFLDSTGIGGLVDLSNVAAKLNKTFKLVEATPEVRRILDLVGLTDLYH